MHFDVCMSMHFDVFMSMYIIVLDDGMIRDDTTIRPKEATEEDLRVVHTKRYINSLRVRTQVLF